MVEICVAILIVVGILSEAKGDVRQRVTCSIMETVTHVDADLQLVITHIL